MDRGSTNSVPASVLFGAPGGTPGQVGYKIDVICFENYPNTILIFENFDSNN